MKKTKTLPDKLSDLLELAIDDCRKIKKLKSYKLDMYNFHFMKRDKKCHVCMAGAVMACGLKAKRTQSYMPDDFDDDTCSKLEAINEMRVGDFSSASSRLFGEGEIPPTLALKLSDKVTNSMYLDKIPGRANWRVYRKCVTELRKAGF
jgi:hypothetical protein